MTDRPSADTAPPDVHDHEHTPLDTLLGAAPRRVARHWLSLLILALAALGAMAFFVRFVAGEDSPYYSAPVERGDLIPLISERGQIHAQGELTVFSPLPGRVTWAPGLDDAQVAQGQLLATIDAGDIVGDLAVDRTRLTSARADLEAAKVVAADAASRLSRFESVWRKSGGRAPSLNEMERARADARRADLAVEGAQATVKAASIQLDRHAARKAGEQVRAPFSGMIVMRHTQSGQQITGQQPLFTIAKGRSPLTIEVPLRAAGSGPMQAGTPATVRLDAFPDAPQSATLTMVRVPPPAQTTQPRPSVGVFTIARPTMQIRPGMAATVEITLPERRAVLLVPNAALEFGRGTGVAKQRDWIFILDDGEPRRVYVTVGASDGKRTEVFANGLEPGDNAIIGWRDAPGGKP